MGQQRTTTGLNRVTGAINVTTINRNVTVIKSTMYPVAINERNERGIRKRESVNQPVGNQSTGNRKCSCNVNNNVVGT